MRLFLILAILPLVSGCANLRASPTAICSGTATDRTAHAEALVRDGGPQSVATGATLLSKLGAGCNE